MAELKFIVSMDSSAFKDGAKDVMAQVKQMSNAAEKSGKDVQKSMDDMAGSAGKSIAKIAAAFGGFAALKSFIGKIVEVRSEFQKTGVAIETLLGSKAKADALLKEVREYAKISPLEFSDITKATQTLISFNIAAEDTPKYIKAIGDISMGEKDRFNSLALAFAQMSASGKLMGQDLMQMINAGFNPLATISEKTGKSIAKLKDEMSKGAISAEMVQQAFIDATSAGGKFYGMSENAAKTIGGQISMMQDALTAAFNKIGEANDGIIMDSVQGLTKLIENYEELIRVLGAAVIAVGGYKASLMLNTTIINIQKEAAKGLTLTQQILNKTMLSNPIVAWGTALTAVVTTIYLAVTAESNYEQAVRKANEAIEEQENRLEQRKNDIESLIGIIQDETKTTYQQIKAYERLKQLAPELTEEYSREALAKMDNAKAQKVLNENMDEMEYDEAIQQVEKYTKAVEEQKKAMEQASSGVSSMAVAGGETREQRNRLETLQVQLDTWVKTLAKIQERQRQIQEEAKPVKVRIEEAKENKKVQEDILKFWQEASKKIDDLMNPNMVMTFEGSKQQLDAYIDEVKGKIDDLQKELDKHPNNPKLELKQEEYQKVLNILIQMRQAWLASGNTTLPITLEAELSENLTRAMALVKTAKNALNKLFNISNTTKKTTDTTTKKTPKSGRGKSEADKKLEAAREQREYLELLDENSRERQRAVEDLERDAQQAQIDAMAEGTDKVLAQAKMDYLRRKKEIEREREDLIQTKIDMAREEFEKDPANKKKIFDPSTVNTAETDKEKQAYADLLDFALKEYNRKLAEVADAERQSMLQYLEQYGTYQQQKLALAEDYEKRIAEAQDEGMRLMLTREMEEELRALDERFGIVAEAFSDLFADAADKSVKSIQMVINKYESLVKYMTEHKGKADGNALKALGLSKDEIQKVLTGKVSIKELTEAIKRLKGVVYEKSPYRSFLDQMKESIKLLKESSGDFNKIGKAITGIGKACNDYMPEVEKFASSLGNIFGIDDELTGGAVNMIRGISSAAAGIGEMLEGNYFDGIVQAAQGLSTAVAGLRDMLYSGRNMDYVYQESELKAIRESVDKILEKMDTSSTADAIRQYEEALARYQQAEQFARNALVEAFGKYSSSLSRSHSHKSVNYYMGQFGGEDVLDEINKLLGTSLRAWGDLWFLSPDQLTEVQRELPQVFAIINKGIETAREKASASTDPENAEKALQAYLDLSGKLEEIENKFRERMTGTTLDAISNEFANALSDMDDATATFSDNFEEMLKNAVINAMMAETFNQQLKDWYASFAEAFRNDAMLSGEEAERLRKDYEAISEMAIKQRDAMFDALGIKADGSYTEGSGAYKALASFSQEQGDELNGRLTAIQIGQQRNNESLLTAVTALQNLSVVITANQGALSEMRNLMLIGNGHLEDIARYTKLTSQNSELLQTIATKIDTL